MGEVFIILYFKNSLVLTILQLFAHTVYLSQGYCLQHTIMDMKSCSTILADRGTVKNLNCVDTSIQEHSSLMYLEQILEPPVHKL